MKLVNAHITHYRSIEDSDAFAVEPDVTCLVGKNESGKTASLRALFRANPIEQAPLDEVVDFPARNTRQRKTWPPEQLIPVVRVEFELDDAEVETVTEQFGTDALLSHQVILTTGYRESSGSCSYDFDERAMLAHLRDPLDLSAAHAELVNAATDIEELVRVLESLEDRPHAATDLYQRLVGWGGTGQLCIHHLLSPHLPKFVYFDDYDVMPGKVSIPDLIRRRDADTLTRGQTALVSLLEMADADLEAFRDGDNHERLVHDLENASASISDEVFEYWTQGDGLSVKLEILQPESSAIPPLNEGPILQVRVWNDRHRVSVPFDERSRGFVWFFSFLAYFNELEQNATQKLILLLDEPGLSLHGRAQQDLLKLIDERLAPKHQVLYTTHSPFMVDPDHLNRVRTVIDKDKVGTKVSGDIFDADDDTSFPLLTAMGVEMTQTLFVGKHTLLVEGPSDLIYLTVLADALEQQGKTGLDNRWVKIPVGGAGKLSVFVTLLGANKIKTAVLIDSSTNGAQAVKRLRDNNQLHKGGVLEIRQFTGSANADIEDLFEPDFYLELVNRAYAKDLTAPITTSDLTSRDPRIVRRVETYFKVKGIAGGHLNHYKPAAVLLREQADLGPISSTTLARAENLFVRLNGLLPA